MKNNAIPTPFQLTNPPDAAAKLVFESVVQRDGRLCQMCGASETDTCPFDHTDVTLFVTLITPSAFGGQIRADNMRTVCSTCAGGLRLLSSNRSQLEARIFSNRPKRVRILSQIRRATIEDQKAVLEWILRKFKLRAIADE